MAEQPLSSDHELCRCCPRRRRERLLICRGRNNGRGLGFRLSGSPFCSLLNGTAGLAWSLDKSRTMPIFAPTSRR
jgi:hypothetical protein